MVKATVELENYPQTWKVGVEIINLEFSLGQGNQASSCKVSLADPTGKLAADLIKHSLSTGGIQAIASPPMTPQQGPNGTVAPSFAGTPANWQQWKQAIVQECLKQGVTDRAQIAYILATAQHESGSGQYLEEIDGPNKSYAPWYGRGLVQITFRENYAKFGRIVGVDLVANKEAATRPDVALTVLVVGMRDGMFTGRKLSDYVGGSRQDFREARRVVNALDRADLIAGYAQTYLSSGEVDRLMNTQGLSTAALNTNPKTPVGDLNTAVEDATFKGSKLTITIDENTYEYYHQGTYTDQEGLTVLVGQSIRWALGKRKRNRTHNQLTLRQLFERVAQAHGLTLDWMADFDPSYTFIDQSGLSDYQLLQREAERVGLSISEEGRSLVVKSLRNLRDTAIVLAVGLNLLSYTIEDKAIQANAEDIGSSLAPNLAKYQIDPLTGQFKAINKDFDSLRDTSITGRVAPKPEGQLAPGQEAIANQNQARMKRVKGLPSTFKIPLNAASLSLKPMDVVRTEGLPGVLSRVWMIDLVTHNVLEGTTTLNVFSPIEVLDLTPPTVTPTQATQVGGTYWIKPVTGFPVTDLVGYSPWRGRNHNGTDIGCPIGTPIRASSNGVVTIAGVQQGYGRVIYMKHPNGYETRYAHLDVIQVSVGQQVAQGQVIGLSGNTGIGTGAHLHWELRNSRGNPIDPNQVGLTTVKGQNW